MVLWPMMDKLADCGLEVFLGSYYRSKNAHMKFNADKSLMNIETNAGKIYVYKRATSVDILVFVSRLN